MVASSAVGLLAGLGAAYLLRHVLRRRLDSRTKFDSCELPTLKLPASLKLPLRRAGVRTSGRQERELLTDA